MSENEFEKVVPETEEPVVEETLPAEENADIQEPVAEEEIQEEISEETEIDGNVEETVSEQDVDVDEILEDGEVTDEELQEVVEDIIEKKKKSKAPFIVIAILVVLAIVAAIVVNSFGGNKYNKLGYANPEGRTIADVSEQMGISLEKFLETYGLPADMPADTEEMASYYSMPVKIFAQMYGVDFATFKEAYGIPEETTPDKADNIIDKIKSIFGGDKVVPIDENTPWGVVLDELSLANYVGEDNLDSFKEFYGLGDEVTA